MGLKDAKVVLAGPHPPPPGLRPVLPSGCSATKPVFMRMIKIKGASFLKRGLVLIVVTPGLAGSAGVQHLPVPWGRRAALGMQVV